MGNFHGCMRHIHGSVLELRPHSGEPGDSCGCLCAGLSAASGTVDLRDYTASAEDPGRARFLVEGTQPGVVAAFLKNLRFSPIKSPKTFLEGVMDVRSTGTQAPAH